MCCWAYLVGVEDGEDGVQHRGLHRVGFASLVPEQSPTQRRKLALVEEAIPAARKEKKVDK